MPRYDVLDGGGAQGSSHAVKICIACFSCCLTVAFVVAGFLFPGCALWAGIILGVATWLALAGGFGWAAATAARGDDNPTTGCVGCLAGVLTFPVSLPAILSSMLVKTIWQADCGEGNGRGGLGVACRRVSAALLIIALLFGGSGAATFFTALRMCITSADDACVSATAAGLALPTGLHLTSSLILYNGKPSYKVFATAGATASYNPTIPSPLGQPASGPQLATFNWKQYTRCTAPGAPFAFSETLQTRSAPPGNRPTQYMDQRTQYVRTSLDAWEVYELRNCANELEYLLEQKVVAMSLQNTMSWTIKAGGQGETAKHPPGTVLAEVEKPFTLFSMPVVRFVAEDGNGTIALLQQSWLTALSSSTLADSWTIDIHRPDVVDPSLFGYVALLIKKAQLDDQKDRDSKNNN